MEQSNKSISYLSSFQNVTFLVDSPPLPIRTWKVRFLASRVCSNIASLNSSPILTPTNFLCYLQTKKAELRHPPPALSTVRSSLFASLALFVRRSTTRVTRHLAYTVSYKHLQFFSLKCNFGSSTK